MIKNKVEIICKDEDGNEVKYYVVRPSSTDLTKAQMEAARVVSECISNKVMMRHQLRASLIESGAWSDEKEKRLEELDNKIVEGLLKLKKGGIKKSEAKDIAIQVRANRTLKMLLASQKLALDEFTTEAMSEDSRFNYLVSVCTKDESGNKVFSSLQNYNERKEEDVAVKAATELSYMLYDLDPDWQKKLPENKFLKEHGYIDDELRLIDKDGHYVTTDGKKIDKNFNYVTEEGVEEVDEDGLPKVEFTPFLD